jgi:hypothetical protein
MGFWACSFAQLVLNAAWSWMFLAANNPLLRLTDIVPQVLANLSTIVSFYQLRQDGKLVPCSAGDVGCLCGRFEFGDLEVEPLAHMRSDRTKSRISSWNSVMKSAT